MCIYKTYFIGPTTNAISYIFLISSFIIYFYHKEITIESISQHKLYCDVVNNRRNEVGGARVEDEHIFFYFLLYVKQQQQEQLKDIKAKGRLKKKN